MYKHEYPCTKYSRIIKNIIINFIIQSEIAIYNLEKSMVFHDKKILMKKVDPEKNRDTFSLKEHLEKGKNWKV